MHRMTIHWHAIDVSTANLNGRNWCRQLIGTWLWDFMDFGSRNEMFSNVEVMLRTNRLLTVIQMAHPATITVIILCTTSRPIVVL